MTTDTTADKPRMVTLRAQSTDMLKDRNEDLSVTFPEDLSERGFEYIIEQLEFRRKCMNQGFDNLLEILDRHRKYWRETVGMPKDDKPEAESNKK